MNQVSSTDEDNSTDIEQRIANGIREDRVGVFPYFVSLQLPFPNGNGSYYHSCGGSLIKRRIIITAAHCMLNTTQVSQYRVLLNKRNKPFFIVSDPILTISKWIIHPEFTLDESFYKYDIAIALLNKADNRQEKTLLKLPNFTPAAYSQCEMMGFGATSGLANADYPDVMLKAIVTIRSDTECLRELGSMAFTPVNNFCVTNQASSSACPGDSGGPIVWTDPDNGDPYLVGTVSSGKMPCHHYQYTNCVNVVNSLDFIQKAVSKLLRP